MRKAIILALILLFLTPTSILAQQTVKVAVTPFSIYSKEDLSYLSAGLQEMLGSRLTDQGLSVVPQADTARVLKELKIQQLDETKAREIGRALGVDYLIYGSLTKVGQSVSLDARVVDVSGVKKTSAVFIQSTGLEELAEDAGKLAREITARVAGRQKIAEINISGNKRVETDAVKQVLHGKTGDIFSADVVSDDLKRIYAMGFFEDVKVDVEDSAEGKIIRFILEERPSIQSIEFSGNRMLDTEDLMAALGYKAFSILNPKKLADSLQQLKDLYREKGYYNADIEYKVDPLSPDTVAVKYKVTEGRRVYVKKIDFLGNKAFTAGKLRGQMKTSQKGFFFWFTDSGILKKEALKADVDKLVSFYHDNGYLKAKVGDPKVEVTPDGLTIILAVDEGPLFRVGQVSISGDLIKPKEELLKNIKLSAKDIYSQKLLQEDLRTIRSAYADQGYAYARVEPNIQEHKEGNLVDINYLIAKNKLVYFERISIVGNDKTRDKAIRRELKVVEGGLFSAEDLRQSAMNLRRLQYFQNVDIVPSPGGEDDKMNLKVEVKEQPTGAFSVGAGYSSFNQVFGLIRVAQNNFRGTGQKLSVQATIGGRTTEYDFSFTEPWLFDIPLTAGFDLFRQTIDYDEYNKMSVGFALRASYPVWENIRLSGRYMLEDNDITEIPDSASPIIKEIAGESTTSILTVMLNRDTRDRFFNPTRGSVNSITVDYAGGLLGGTNSFTRYVANSGWYIPTFWENFTFFVRGQAGYAAQGDDGKFPAYEKFFLGGINSLRGFKWASVTPSDPATGDKLGGEKMVLLNLEFIFPILKEAGLMGVVFFDQGNVWTKDQDYDLSDLRRSYGAGIRYYSPFGPLRLEYGFVLDPRAGEPSSNLEFSVGTAF